MVKLADRDKKEKRNPRGTWGAWPDSGDNGNVSVNDSCRKFQTSWISQDRLSSISVMYTDDSTDSDISPDPAQPLCQGCWQEGVDHSIDCPCGTPYYTCRTDHVDEHDGHIVGNLGISPIDPNQFPSPGESFGVRLTTDAPYSQVYWYVKAPWETSYYGTNVEIDSGDGSTTEASLSYTFPSGAMHTGDFIITAYIYRSDQSVYEETYTVNVTMP